MKRLRWLLPVLAALPLAVGGLVVGASSRSGYPDAVYYVHYVDPGASSAVQTSLEEWVDPVRHRDYTRMRIPENTTTTLDRAGFSYQVIYSAHGVTDTLPPQPYSEPADVIQRDRELLAGGWPLVYRRLLAQHGPVARVQLARHQVLRFVLATGTTVWVDPRTRLPVQEQLSGVGPQGAVRVVQWRRYPPYTLPATFFDPPHTQQSLWERLTGWLQDHGHI